MTTIEVKYDQFDKLCVDVDDGEMTTLIINDDEIVKLLKVVNGVNFESVRIYKNSLKLITNDEEVIIRDIDKFCKDMWIDRLPSVAMQAKNAISKYNRNKGKTKTRRNVKFGRRRVVGTGIIFALLIISSVIASKVNTTSKDVPDGTEQLDEHTYDSLLNIAYNNTNMNYSFDDFKDDMDEIAQAKVEAELGEMPLTEQITESQKEGYAAYIDYSLSTDDEKRAHAYDNYHEIVEEYAAKWGISSNLIMAILTQESGGYKTNLMQIEFDVWKDQEIKVYNFRDGKYEYFVLTNNPENYDRSRVTCITEKDLDNPITNISIACVLLRKSAEYMDYHVLAAIQCYNLGKGNMDYIFEIIFEETGQTREEILSDQENISFYQYTSKVDEGDPFYLSNVFAFLSDYGETITFKHFGDNHEIVEEEITIFSTQNSNNYH